MSAKQLDLEFAGKAASRHANDIKVLTPLARELALKAGEAGITIADIRVAAQQRLLLPQRNTHDRSLAWLGALPRAAGLIATDRTRRSSIPHSNANRHTVWVAPRVRHKPYQRRCCLMARGRMLNKTVAHSPQLAGVSLLADYLFMRCLPHLDVEGRMVGHPTVVKAMAVPLRAEITIERIPTLLAELDEAGLLVWYEVQGKQIIEYPGFHNHQSLNRKREARSHLPARTEDARLLARSDRNQLTLLHEPSGNLQGNRTEGSLKPLTEPSGNIPSEVEVEVEVEIKPPLPRAREAFRQRLDDPTLTVVDDFLSRLPARASRERWIALIGGWLDGLDIRPPTPTADDLRVALNDYLAEKDRDFAPAHVRAFVEQAARQRTRPPPRGALNGGHGRKTTAAEQSVINSAIALKDVIS